MKVKLYILLLLCLDLPGLRKYHKPLIDNTKYNKMHGHRGQKQLFSKH